jgi:predicted Zn-dependent peptidase
MLTNRMLREGTERYSAAAIAERFDYYGSWVELSTSMRHAFITVYSLNKYLAPTLDIVASMVREPIFSPKELQTVVDVNMQQYKISLSKVGFLSQRDLMRTLYGKQHPCGRMAVEEDYLAATPDMLRHFHLRHYHSEGCSIFLSGQVTEEVTRQVADRFGEPFGANVPPEAEKRFTIATAPGKRVFTERADALQSAVKMGTITIGNSHPDYLKLKVVMTLLGGYFGSRLMSNIREEKGYTYGISAGIATYPDSGIMIIGTETANEYVEPLIGEVYREIDRLHDEQVGEEELTLVRNYMMGEMCRGYESPFSLADAWISVDTMGLPADYFDRSVEAVKSITPTEIQDLARRYLRKETLKEVIAGKKMSQIVAANGLLEI